MKLGELAGDKTREIMRDACVRSYNPQDKHQGDAYRAGFDEAYSIWSKAFKEFQERMRGG